MIDTSMSTASDLLAARYAEQPFLMAPMASVTDAAYRIMCRRRGAATAYSEMVSVAGLAYASEKTWELVLPAKEEPQICVQLFGTHPDQFTAAVESVAERVGDKLTSIDINMACPARKVVAKGEGCALMQTPELAVEIARAAVEHSSVPVTCKMRTGYLPGERTAPDFAAALEQAGVAGVAVHGRTAKQLYTGSADWSIIDEVAERVNIPVVGSGDVFTAQDAVRMLQTTAASAVFIARGTYGNPWIFSDAQQLLTGANLPQHGTKERLDALREHLTLVSQLAPHMARSRTFTTWYLKGMPHAAFWRGRAVRCTTFEDFMQLVDAIEADVTACEQLAASGEPVPAQPFA